MADIQPKNTDTIRVNKVKEKTASAGITLDNTTLVDDVREKTSSSGVSLNQIIKFTTALIPLAANIDCGTSTGSEHIRELFVKTISSNGQDLSIGADSAHAINLRTNDLTRVSVESDGDIAQDATNGGNLLWSKASTCVTTGLFATGLTAAGTIITDALDLTAVTNEVTTVAAGSGVQLWDAPTNSKIEIYNGGANALLVYPHSGSATINGGAGGASVSIASGSMGIFYKSGSTTWRAREIVAAVA